MEIEDINNVLIVGAGTMGQQIASQCALHGLDVILYDIKQDILDHALARINKLLKYFVSKNKYSQKAVDAVMEKEPVKSRGEEGILLGPEKVGGAAAVRGSEAGHALQSEPFHVTGQCAFQIIPGKDGQGGMHTALGPQIIDVPKQLLFPALVPLNPLGQVGPG